LEPINPWALAAATITLGMVYIVCIDGIAVAWRKSAMRLTWTLIFILGLVSALALTVPLLAMLL